jgi:hypothetical protein
MDNYQKVEQLVNKSGCSYEDAKAALEACGWDMLDAVISLEKEGKIIKEQPEAAESKTEETVEIIPEVVNDKGYDNAGSKKQGKTKEASKKVKGLWNRLKSILTENRMVMIKSNGQQIFDLPIWVPVLALAAFFWATLILAVIAMLFGCRFHFEGADLGKAGINDTMDKATDYAEKVREDISERVNGKQDTDN